MSKSWLKKEITLATAWSSFVRRSGARKIEEWLREHADLAALAIVAVGFMMLVAAARNRPFTPDEALDVELVNLPDFFEAYRRSTWHAHPPLFFLILHFWLALGHSEIVLRMLPAIFGGAFLWCTYRWAGDLFGKPAGLITLLIVILSPACVPLSAEVRDYSLLLLLSVAAMAQLERAVKEDSPLRMSLFSLLLSLAILTHYSALLIAASLGLYALIRLRASGSSRRVIAVWAGLQVVVAVLSLILYLSHLASLRGSEMEQRFIADWLGPGFFQPGREGPVAFVVRQTGAVFHYFFSSKLAAGAAVILAVVGIVFLAIKRRPPAILLVLPLTFGAAGGLLGLYPFGGTRHSVYLIPFVAAAIAVAVSPLIAGRSLGLFLASVGVTVLLRLPVLMTASQDLSQLNAAMDQLGAAVQPGSLIVADGQTAALLGYYLGRNASSNRQTGLGHFFQSNVDQYCIVSSPLWNPNARAFADEVESAVKVYQLPAGQRFWVMHFGIVGDPTVELVRRFEGSVIPGRFGDILVFQVWPQGNPEGVPSGFSTALAAYH